jgi:hypothetical protein
MERYGAVLVRPILLVVVEGIENEGYDEGALPSNR